MQKICTDVRGHQPIQDANSFLRAKLEKKCELQETYKSKDKDMSIYLRKMEAIVFIIL